MPSLQRIGRAISNAVAVATDWLLISLGLLMVLIAVVKIDVPTARYVVVCGGVALSGFGFWFRWQRLRRQE